MTELQRVDGAVFYALSAGDALAGIHLGDVVGAHHIHVFEHRGGAQGETAAAAAVADGVCFTRAVRIRNLVHESVFFRMLEDFVSLFACNLTSSAGSDIVFRRVTHLDAHVFLEVPAALAHDLAVGAAAARGDGEDIVFLQIGGDFLVAGLVAFSIDGALNRDDAHEPNADWERAGAHRPAHAPVGLHGVANDGVLLDHIKVVDDHFHRAGDPRLRPEHVSAFDIVDKASAVDRELHELLVAVRFRLADDGGDFGGALFRIRAEGKADFAHIVADARLEDDILRVIPVVAALFARFQAGFLSADHVGKRHDVVAVLANVSFGESHLGDAIHKFFSPYLLHAKKR